MSERFTFWRRTPPALFPSTLGMLGLALGWFAAERALGAPGFIGHVVLGAGVGFFAFAFGCYCAKVHADPRVVFADMNPVPGRAAVSAGSMCLMVVAAGIGVEWGLVVEGQVLWLFGLVLHVAYMICVIMVLVGLPPEERVVTPVLFLPFVGYIVSPIAGAPLGLGWIATPFYLYSLMMGAVIVALSTPKFFTRPTPVPARASAAILLAPTSVAAISGAALGWDWLLPPFLAVSIAVAVVLAVKVRWLTAGGFTPLWGAFTFPAASFAGVLLIAAERWGGAWGWAAWAALIFATLVVIPIWALTIRAWARGELAPATGAKTV